MKIKLMIFSLIVTLIGLYVAGCDRGTDSVDFTYYLDANDRQVVHFKAQGKSDFGEFAYEWDYGDGTIGSGKTSTHTFGEFGKFTVTLTATIEDSNIETMVSKEIVVEIPQITDLDFEVFPDKKNPRLYNFKATSKVDYGNVEYEWDFGDGMTASGENVQYGFEYFGLYEIELTAKLSDYESVDKVIYKKNIEIAAPAITRLDFVATQDNDNPFLYHFTPIAEASWGTIEYEWDFGDGKIAFDNDNPTNIYSKYSTYIVKLKGRLKETGSEEITSKEVSVQVPIFKNYEITHTVDEKDPLQVYFTIENKDGEDDEDMSQQDSFQWEFGDGETASGLRTQHRYETYGDKTVYVTLRTPDQTQKTLTKDLKLETPYINNIKITGQPSLKASNLIEYRVTANSEFEDEIEYEWEFEDGTKKSGRTIERVMEFWPKADNSRKITEKIYLRTKIPRLNVSIRNSEPYEVKVLRPYIANFEVNCVNNTPSNLLDQTCRAIGEDGKTPTVINGGGEIVYEWVFNGQTYTGANQRFTLPAYNQEYEVIVTAQIKDTNITNVKNKGIISQDNGTSFTCSTDVVDDYHDDALKIKCKAVTSQTHYNIKTTWNMGDGKEPIQVDGEEVEYKYEKAGAYPITMTFKSAQSMPFDVTKKYGVLVNLYAGENNIKSDWKGTHSCSGGKVFGYGREIYISHNLSKFREQDFNLSGSISKGGFNCRGQENNGIAIQNVTWDIINSYGLHNGAKIGGAWGDWHQYINFKLCFKDSNIINKSTLCSPK